MTKRPLYLMLLISTLVLVGLNGLMGSLTRRLPYHIKLESIRNAGDSNVLFVGNSLLDGHLNESAMTASAARRGLSIHPLNAALGGSEPPEQRLLFHYAAKIHGGISTLVVGFYDFQLTAPDLTHAEDLKGNRMVGVDHRFSAQEVVEAYGFGAEDQAKLVLERLSPMVANRASAWRQVELMRRSLAQAGMPTVATNSMGRAADFAALEAGSAQVFDAKASAFLANPSSFNLSFEAIFREAQDRKMKVVLVAMPMSPTHWNAYYSRPLWARYQSAIETLAAARGIRFIDASDWMHSQSDFADHLHMAPEVIDGFSERLGSELVRTR